MKNFCLLFGLLIIAGTALAQYSYVYQIRHDNKEESRPIFRDLTQYKPSGPPEQLRSDAIPREAPKTRDFEVKPGIGPNLMNAINKQNMEKTSESSEAVWGPAPDSKHEKSSLVLQSDTNSPIYARQPSRAYSSPNEMPIYGGKLVLEDGPKGYPIMEPQEMRERKRDEPKPLSYSLSMPAPQLPRPTYRPLPNRNDDEQKLRTVHSIQTPNYKIQLVSQPEPLEQLLPLLKQYQLSTKPFQSQEQSHSYSQSHQPQSYAPLPPPHSPPSHSHYSPPPSDYPESGKALMVSVEPDARIREEIRPRYRDEPKSRDIPSIDRQIYEERPKMMREFRPDLKPAPKPILELPRQELPPQIRKLSPQSLQKLAQNQRNVPNVPVYQTRPQYAREELVPVTALYQIAPPNLSKGSHSYSGVQYAEEEPKREGRQSITTYKDEPVIYRIIDSEGQDKSQPLPFDIHEQLEKLGRENPTAQKIFLEKIKSDAIEMPERGQIQYLKYDDQTVIPTDPNYKSSPLPEEYKPYTQTRYYKAYV